MNYLLFLKKRNNIFFRFNINSSFISELISKREIPETIRSKNKYIDQFAKIQKITKRNNKIEVIILFCKLFIYFQNFVLLF